MQEIEEKLGYCMLDTLKCAFNKSTQKIILSKTFSNDTLSLFKPQQNIQFIVLPHYHFLIEHYFITHQYHNLNLINPSSIQPPFIFSQPNTHISHLQQLPQNTIQMLYPIGTNQQPFQHQQVLSCYDFTNVECSDSFSTHHSFQSNDSYNYCNPKMFYERETPNHFSSDYNEIGSIEDYSNQAERKEIFEMTNNGTPVSMLSPVDNTFTPNVSTDSPTYELKFCFKEIHNTWGESNSIIYWGSSENRFGWNVEQGLYYNTEYYVFQFDSTCCSSTNMTFNDEDSTDSIGRYLRIFESGSILINSFNIKLHNPLTSFYINTQGLINFCQLFFGCFDGENTCRTSISNSVRTKVSVYETSLSIFCDIDQYFSIDFNDLFLDNRPFIGINGFNKQTISMNITTLLSSNEGFDSTYLFTGSQIIIDGYYNYKFYSTDDGTTPDPIDFIQAIN
ncbi:hypothetical protein QTN25_007264 [Entamoeba marina]